MEAYLPTLMTDWLGKPLWMWLVFLTLVGILLVLDLGVLHRKTREIEVQESLYLSAGYITLGLLFGGWVWYELGPQSGLEYLTGFVVEKSLALDNVFVIAMIFGVLGIPRLYQHRVLFWGILGVIVLRGIMIGLGATLVQQFHWILYFFAAFLIFTGIKMWQHAGKSENLNDSAILKFIKKHFNVTDKLHGQKFFVRQKDPKTGKMAQYITPLFVALIMVEIIDLVFAVDSVPAVFAITTDPFIVYTSNIMAILGLRALYFALAAMVERFKYLKYALAILLVFIGSKIFIAAGLGLEKFPSWLSLSVTFLILAVGVGYSLYKTRAQPAKP
jgi:tellurite resistance protein TerC